jgi:hypothetical protein
MSLADKPERNFTIDLLAQGHRLVELAWLSIEIRILSEANGALNVLLKIDGVLRICRDLDLMGSKFIELWTGCGENAKTFLEEIAYRYALEQDASGAVC